MRLGVIMGLEGPSLLMALPRITAHTGSPSARASGFSSTMAAPSARTKPSARSSNALHCPSAESIPACENVTAVNGCNMALAPPAKAIVQLLARRLFTARCTATSEDEHAVSTARHGPLTPKKYASRPGAAPRFPPIPV